jgi:hypothetical protein
MMNAMGLGGKPLKVRKYKFLSSRLFGGIH